VSVVLEEVNKRERQREESEPIVRLAEPEDEGFWDAESNPYKRPMISFNV
jgi:hypothetical protein